MKLSLFVNFSLLLQSSTVATSASRSEVRTHKSMGRVAWLQMDENSLRRFHDRLLLNITKQPHSLLRHRDRRLELCGDEFCFGRRECVNNECVIPPNPPCECSQYEFCAADGETCLCGDVACRRRQVCTQDETCKSARFCQCLEPSGAECGTLELVDTCGFDCTLDLGSCPDDLDCDENNQCVDA